MSESNQNRIVHSDEFARIQKIKKQVGPPSSRVHLGIGDDAAIVESPQGKLLLCTDAMVEGVHFDLAYCSAADLGHKALASCLSDIAAMNGEPLYALFTLAIPINASSHFLDEFYSGATALAHQCNVDIVGGDLSSSPQTIFIDTVCVGHTEAQITRAGAKPGDWLAVSGNPGASAAGLAGLRQLPRNEVPEALACAHLRPRPRFDLLKNLAPVCTSLIDISDGISSEVHHLARASNVGIQIEASRMPISPQTFAFALTQTSNPSTAFAWALDCALNGGEDYELLATLDPAKVETAGGPPPGFTIIGQVIQSGMNIINKDGTMIPLQPAGFNHFASS